MIQVSHILYLSEKPGSYAFGGAENHIMTLLPALKERGADVELIVLLWNKGATIKARLAEIKEEGVRVSIVARENEGVFKTRLSRALKTWYQLYRLLTHRKNRIIHAHLDLRAVLVTAWFAKCSKLVLTIHNDERYYAHLFWFLWLRVIDRFIKAYIAITCHVRNYYLSKSGISPSKISTIYYGVKCQSKADITRLDFHVDPSAYVVGFVGRLSQQKNLKVLIEALAEIPEVTGVIVGHGELKEELEAFVRKRMLRNIIFLGAVPNGASLMPIFDIFCLPSIWEGLGLVLIEAMLQKVPIIASRAGAIPEILGQGEYGILFDPNDSNALAEIIRYSQQNPQILSKKANKAYEYAKRNFTVKEMVRKTLNVYESLNRSI